MKKNINIKNYILLVLLFVAAMAATLYVCECYRVYDEHQKETPVIRGTLSEITSEEVNHYVVDNPVAVMYLCTSNSDVCRNYEKGLIKLVNKLGLEDNIIYVNLTNADQEEFVNNFNEKYDYKVNLTTTYPAFVTFEDGKVTNILQGSKKKPLTISKTKEYFEINHIGE